MLVLRSPRIYAWGVVTDPARTFDEAIRRIKAEDDEDALTAEFLHLTDGI